MNEKYINEYNKLLEIGKKKGALQEEVIYDKFLKYEATASDTDEIIAKLKENGIRIIPTIKPEELEKIIEEDGKANIICNFCKEEYNFDKNDLEELLRQSENK